jgi:hypothetical protein
LQPAKPLTIRGAGFFVRFVARRLYPSSKQQWDETPLVMP